MSLVGPRPETPEFVAMYSPRRTSGPPGARPGMAGPSTLAFESEAEVLARSADPYRCYVDHLMHERVRADLEYLDRQSLRYDLGVLLGPAHGGARGVDGRRQGTRFSYGDCRFLAELRSSGIAPQASVRKGAVALAGRPVTEEPKSGEASSSSRASPLSLSLCVPPRACSCSA